MGSSEDSASRVDSADWTGATLSEFEAAFCPNKKTRHEKNRASHGYLFSYLFTNSRSCVASE